MRSYELTLVVDPDLTAEKRKKLTSGLKKIIEALKGKVEKEDEWGKRDLVYPIKKKKMGYYLWWIIKLPSQAVAGLDQKLRLEKQLIRYLLVNREQKGRKHGKQVS